MKFPTATGIGQVRGRQCDSRECYSKSLELAKMEPELPQAMEVKKISRGPMETNIDPRLQEDESSAEPVEELTEIQLNPDKLSCVVKIGKRVKERTSIIVCVIPITQPRHICMETCRHGGDPPRSYVSPIEH